MELPEKKNSYFLYPLESIKIKNEGNGRGKVINFGFFSSYKQYFIRKHYEKYFYSLWHKNERKQTPKISSCPLELVFDNEFRRN
jgi:hypothetical protein